VQGRAELTGRSSFIVHCSHIWIHADVREGTNAVQSELPVMANERDILTLNLHNCQNTCMNIFHNFVQFYFYFGLQIYLDLRVSGLCFFTCVYVHAYIYIFICMRIYTYSYACVYIHIHMHAYIYIFICMRIYTYSYACVYIHIHMHAYIYIFICMRIYTYSYACVYIHIHMHAYM
jgi:hypothetical protein